MAISKKISELDVLTSPQDLTKLFPPLFAQDGSPLNIRMSMAEVLKSATQVAINSGTLTGSSSPALSITQTWNNAATTFTGALINVTDTASAAASKLLDLQLGGSSKANVRKDGVVFAGIPATYGISYGNTSGSSGIGFYSSGARMALFADGSDFLLVGNNTIDIVNGKTLGFESGNSGSPDLVLTRDAADVLAIRRSGNAELVRVYETYTDSTTFSRGVFGFRDSASGGTGTGSATTVLRIGTEKGSVGGTARALSIITDGVERIGVGTTGTVTFSAGITTGNNSSIGGSLTAAGTFADNNGIRTRSDALIGFSSTTSASGTVDTAITRPAANILGITNGSTGPGTLAIDNVQGTNFERLKMEWDTNVARIGTSKGGSGTARDFAIITDNAVRVTFAAAGGQTAADGHNMAFGTSTGTKIGTATGQKIGFWNATPVVQQVLATGAGATVDNVITLLQTLGLCKQS